MKTKDVKAKSQRNDELASNENDSLISSSR